MVVPSQPTIGILANQRLEYAREVIRAEAAALELIASRIGPLFSQAIDLIQLADSPRLSHGRVLIAGTGKSADVGQKMVGTLNSTGTRAYLLDPTRAMHGDLGMVHKDDVALILSHSGESEEIIKLIGPLRPLVRGIIAITGNGTSTLARKADIPLIYGPLDEVCPLGLAPSASTTSMIALGDALAFVLSREREFTSEDFARFHPAGSLGRKLLKVENAMRNGEEIRIAPASDTVRTVFAHGRHQGRRTGAVILINPESRLVGLFTDSDLARLIENRRDEALDRPISEVMTANPLTATVGMRVQEAIEILKRHKISELPVVDGDGKPIGMLDITDLLGLVATPATENPSSTGGGFFRNAS